MKKAVMPQALNPDAQRKYLSSELAENHRYLAGVDAADTVMQAELYKQAGLLHVALGRISDSHKAAGEAFKCFSQAIALDADFRINAFCLRKRASLNFARGLVNAGIQDLIAACKADSNDWQVWFEYGEVLIDLKAYEEAVESLKKSLLLRPFYAQTQRLLETAIAEGKLLPESLESTQRLIEAKCLLQKMNATDLQESGLALWLQAARLGDLALVTNLASQVDPQIRDGLGNTAVHYAARFGHTHLIPFLKSYVDLNLKNSEGLTPVEVAISEKNDVMVQTLIDAGAVHPAEAALREVVANQDCASESSAGQSLLFEGYLEVAQNGEPKTERRKGLKRGASIQKID